MSQEDPFECFGEETGDSNNKEGMSDVKVVRDPSNGTSQFHEGTEQAMLLYVQQEVAKKLSDGDDVIDPVQKAQLVLKTIDEFCITRHWMMHLGDKKGPIMKDFLIECCDSKPDDRPLVFVEIGTYCGYSSTLLASFLKGFGRSFDYYTVDVDEERSKIARQIHKLVGFDDCIHPLVLNPKSDTLESLLRKHLKTDSIDLLFLDHAKSLYLSDLQQLENCGLIRKGSFVAADNIVYFDLKEYRQHFADMAERGIVRTRLVESWLEYCEPDIELDKSRENALRDGVGKSHITHTEDGFGKVHNEEVLYNLTNCISCGRAKSNCHFVRVFCLPSRSKVNVKIKMHVAT